MKIKFYSHPVFSIIPLIIGVLFIGFGVTSLCIRYTKMQTFETTQGKVIDFVENRRTTTVNGHRETRTTYAPIYEYEVDGDTYTYQSNYSTNYSSLPELGTSQKIYYNPENPKDALAERSNFLEIIFIIIGFFPLISFIFTLIMFRRKNKDEANNVSFPGTY